MAQDTARVAIVDQNSGKKYQVILPTNVSSNRVLSELVKQLELSTEGQGGAPIRYNFHHRTEEGHTTIEGEETLAEAGVQDGSVLQITPEMRAGARGELCVTSRLS